MLNILKVHLWQCILLWVKYIIQDVTKQFLLHKELKFLPRNNLVIFYQPHYHSDSFPFLNLHDRLWEHSSLLYILQWGEGTIK